jgi:hypothetical protein
MILLDFNLSIGMSDAVKKMRISLQKNESKSLLKKRLSDMMLIT